MRLQDSARRFHLEGDRSTENGGLAPWGEGAAARCTGPRASDRELVRRVLDAAEQGGNRLLFCSVAWEVGHGLIVRQEFAQAAGCFRRLARLAEGAADGFLAEAARVALRLCALLGGEGDAASDLTEARAALSRDLMHLSYEEVRAVAAVLDAHGQAATVRFPAPGGGRSPRDVSGASRALAGKRAGVRSGPSGNGKEACRGAGSGRSRLEVRFLGGFGIRRDGSPVALRQRGKAMSILRYLLAHRPRPVSQDYLMGWLWPDSDLRRARWSLNSAIYALRGLLSDEANPLVPSPILLEEGNYKLSPAIEVRSDVDEFDRRRNEGMRLERAGLMHQAGVEYAKSRALYRGDFLVEDMYEDWSMIERHRLLDAYIDLLGRLAGYHMATGGTGEVMDLCYQIMKKDHSHEETYRRLMKCYLRLGLRGRALQQYKLCERVLGQAYGIRPSRETLVLYESLRKGDA